MARPPADQALLNEEVILDAAFELVDEQGLKKLSMRGLASELGVALSSLYHWIPNKQALLHRLYERGCSRLVLPENDPGTSWEYELRRVARSMRRLWHEHPNLVPLFIDGGAPTRTELVYHERILSIFELAGVSRALLPTAVELFPTFLLGFLVAESRGDFSSERFEAVGRMASSEPDDFPILTAATFPDPDELFESMLDLLEVSIRGLGSSAPLRTDSE